ncbi:MAG: DUF3131 domain-containing protein [Candidatus Omnitrophica bacterium]|nr:DUF3131 domain-containing protein [Candidatus Omnitrophota bacterium]
MPYRPPIEAFEGQAIQAAFWSKTIMNKCLALLLVFFFTQSLPVFAAPSQPEAEPVEPIELIVHDFETGTLENNLGGESGAWDVDPEDDTADAYPDIEPGQSADGEGLFLKLTYDVDSPYPSSNGFWTKLKNLDASQYDHLEFDVKQDAQKGATEIFKIEIKKFKDKERVEKLKGTYIVNGVTKEWKHVSIPLGSFTGLLNFADEAVWKNPAIALTDLDEFVVVFEDRRVSQKEGVLYFDNIKFTKTGEPGPNAMQSPERKIEKTPVRLEGLEYQQFLVSRLRGYPKKTLLKKEFSKDDNEFLMEVARDTWRFFDEAVDREHHLVLDTIQMGKETPVAQDGWVGDYTNITNVGLYFMVMVSAYDFGFISKEEAVKRILATLETMRKLEHHSSGFPYNYYDTSTLERTSHFVSFVDSSWLAAGLIVAKNAFPGEVGKSCEDYLNQFDFSFFYDPVERQMFHGYYAHMNLYADYHYGAFYSESRAGSYIAIGRGQVPVEHWFHTYRTFPENYAWQFMEPLARKKKKVLGAEFYGGYYEWQKLKYVPSWGGSLFEALMPVLVLDEYRLAPEGLGLNDKRHVEGHILYTLGELKYPVWGMSPSAIPEGGYSEYGAKPMGSKGYKAGAVSPHAGILALEVAPEIVIANLRRLIALYDIYGEYGFYDAVNPKTGQVAFRYLALDQGMIFVALNNYLHHGAIRKRFNQDPLNEKAAAVLTAEKLFEPDQGMPGATS